MAVQVNDIVHTLCKLLDCSVLSCMILYVDGNSLFRCHVNMGTPNFGDPQFWGPRPQIYIDMGTPIPISMVDMGTPIPISMVDMGIPL